MATDNNIVAIQYQNFEWEKKLQKFDKECEEEINKIDKNNGKNISYK